MFLFPERSKNRQKNAKKNGGYTTIWRGIAGFGALIIADDPTKRLSEKLQHMKCVHHAWRLGGCNACFSFQSNILYLMNLIYISEAVLAIYIYK
jgi:hypothetical protein